MDEHLTISRPDQLHALGDPTRWRILGVLLEGSASVQELARALGAAKGTVAHHVRVLHAAGLVRIAETRRVRGVVEKRYARVARQFRLQEGDPEGMGPAAGKLAASHMPLRQALAEARPRQGPETDDPSMSIVVRARMPAERARRFASLVAALAGEFADGAPGDGETFGFVAAVYVPDWAGATREAS
ncbi:MAG: helix-turn-helix domain-containing protein [Chloroflexota bacterium]|nr:helix-turn-helix domain-containing protein [Chloroflexota bacterium]